ncbi:MAG: topA [Chlamydiales bacterium]|jgi:DNA topoisomerase-1|nr:topA [Chlamydiales bacterium]
MGKSLVIVESPAKIKTLKKILGSDFILESSIGHIRDLPQKEFGIDAEHGFEPTYVTMPDKAKVIEALKKAAKSCDTVYLSPDPDREGEAIAWHIASILPPGTNIKRATFSSITKEAVLEAINNPRTIDHGLVNAQQARRLLDRIVGYKISPILSRRVQRSTSGPLSAGRVQSVALKLVVDREKEIEAFKPVEYWNIRTKLQSPATPERPFEAYLHSVEGKKVEKEPVPGKEVFLIPNKETADSIIERLQKATYKVEKVEKKEKKRNPEPPFITSTLQQEASRHYGFSASRTMSIAQGLYEGIDLADEGREGLITYMRTDSVRTAPEALYEVRKLVSDTYGKEYLPDHPRSFSAKASAQDAHEAIRPTHVWRTPESLQAFLTPDQYKLYVLIWRRFVASQMNPAIYDTVSADIATNDRMILRATGSILKFRGFLVVYEEKRDEEKEDDDENRLLPPLTEQQLLDLIKVFADQAFTRAPPRFTEALLIKELEKSGIGRPSTYASIMNKIQSREYTLKENNRLKPTELGRIISQLLEDNFRQIMDVNFTAMMEDELEEIAQNKKDWRGLLKQFWDHFIPTVQAAEQTAYVPKVTTDLECPKCKSKLQKIWAGSKYFYGCSGYPDCDYKVSIEEFQFNKDEYDSSFNWDQNCPICEGAMQVRHGRFGAFLGCSRYPDCRGIVNIPKKGEKAVIPATPVADCPAIGCNGKMVARKSRFGKIFYSCTTFPTCDVIVNKLEDLQTKYAQHQKQPYEKKSKGKTAKKESAAKGKSSSPKKATKTKGEASMAEKEKKTKANNFPTVQLPPFFADVVDSTELARTELTKRIWDYIKKHNLQDAQNKRMINPDAKLAKLLGTSDQISMFQMTKAVNDTIKNYKG